MAINDDVLMTKPVRMLYYAALEIVEDFDNYGEVLQVGVGSEYGEDTALGKLKAALIIMEG